MTDMRKLLSNTFVGFLPWVAASLIAGPGRFELGFGTGLALAVLMLILGIGVGMKPKLLDLFGIVFFAAMLVVGLRLDGSDLAWLETWSGEISNVALVVVALFSILIRTPFTIQYAREQTPREFWDTPLFLKINDGLTWAWTLAFAVIAVVGYIGNGPLDDPNNLWTGWIIQIGAIVLALKFTEWYPDHATDDSSSGGVRSLLAPVAGFLPVAGILALIFDAGPWWVGVALIVGGVALTRRLKRPGERAPAPETAHAGVSHH
jgi:hypothetical protein